MIDSHAHLDFPQFDPDRDEVIKSGFKNGLEAVVNIGIDMETSRKSVELAMRHQNIFATVGVHPHDAQERPPDYIEILRKMVDDDSKGPRKIVAIGEIGLDYYRDMSPRDVQRKVFAEQLELAKSLELPVVIHIREAMADSLAIIKESGILRGVLHSFPGSADEARNAIDLGFFISFAGPITYPKSNRPDVASALPLGRVLVETDSPYLTPQAFRGKRNKPEYVRYVIEKLADIFAPYTFEDIERMTSLNARRLFGLPIDKKGKAVYKIRRSLYINLTNRCTNNCHFCVRRGPSHGYVAGHYLFLDSEPTSNDVIAGINGEKDFDEIVFCGLGEPTLRLKEMLEICAALKKSHPKTPIRLDTNGHGNLINKMDVPPKLVGFVDRVSVSLNAQDAETYVRICNPDRGRESYGAMLRFIKDCVAQGMPVETSVVDLPEIDIAACRALAESLGATLRIRRHSQSEI